MFEQRFLMVGSAIAGIIALAIIFAVIYISIEGSDIPDILSNWGGVILGFYFGTFMGLVKDWIQMRQGRGTPTPPSRQ